ncbi:TPA: hypothetical protein MZJ90_001041 [Listeria monocytogenes]|nr:hypothetical protein [Listeria monocytogenes]EKZ0297152.1 hypothetical protein [Listeria monocytogenes]HAK1614780.1 hypothetical protein [Listeria monocytogenes]HCB4243159.1 hypothetical protein [Listeria monocytogenes]
MKMLRTKLRQLSYVKKFLGEASLDNYLKIIRDNKEMGKILCGENFSVDIET